MQSEFQVADIIYPKMVGGYKNKAIFVDEMESEGLGMSGGVNEFDDRVFANTITEGYVPAFLEEYDQNYDTEECDENFEGMIFMSNRQTKKECFNRELFGLPISQASVVMRVKPGMKLFLFEYERRQLYGVFEAISSGALNIEPNAFKTSGGSFPAQVRIKTVWNCNPLSEEQFRDAIFKNYFTPKKFHFYLSQEQVLELIRLFSSQKIEPEVLKAPVRFGANEDLREKLDRQHKTTMFLQEVRSKMSARESDFTNIEEDETLYTEDPSVGQGMRNGSGFQQRPALYSSEQHKFSTSFDQRHAMQSAQERNGDMLYTEDPFVVQGMRDGLDSQQRPALYSSEQPKFSTSFDQRHAMQSAQERDVSSNCEQSSALRYIQQCNLSGSCEQRVALHSAQQPNVSSGAEQIHALHSVQNPIFSGRFEQGLAEYSVQQPNVSSSVDMSNSAFQPSYMRGYPSSEEKYLVSGNAFANDIKTSDEMDNTNGRDFYIPSNYRHYDSLHFNESGGPHIPLSSNSMPGIHAMPIDERLWFERQALSQSPLNNSPVNHNNESFFSHKDIFLDNAPSQVMEQPEGPVLRHKPTTAAMSFLRSDNSTQKASVFTRLRRVPQTDVSNDRDHGDLLRRSHFAKSNVQQYPQKLLRSLGKKPEILGGAHDRKLDVVVKDRKIVNDGIPTNYKQRSKVSNAGTELNMQVETQCKFSHNSLDIEDTDEQTVNDVMKINFKRRSEMCKAVKESNLQVEGQTKSNDGEPNSHGQKRRRLVRPVFNNLTKSQANVLPVFVPESVENCHVESKLLTWPENNPCTNSIVNGSVHVAESVEKCHVEFKILSQQENDPISNSIVNISFHVAESVEKTSVESKTSTPLENDAITSTSVNMKGLHDSDCSSELEGKCPVENKNLTHPENDASTNMSARRIVVGLLDSDCISESKGQCPVESKNSTQSENDGSPIPIVTRNCPIERKNSNQPDNDLWPNSTVTSVVNIVGSVPECVEDYPVENKILVQPENDVSATTIVNNSAAALVDSPTVNDQDIPVVNKMDAKEK